MRQSFPENKPFSYRSMNQCLHALQSDGEFNTLERGFNYHAESYALTDLFILCFHVSCQLTRCINLLFSAQYLTTNHVLHAREASNSKAFRSICPTATQTTRQPIRHKSDTTQTICRIQPDDFLPALPRPVTRTTTDLQAALFIPPAYRPQTQQT